MGAGAVGKSSTIRRFVLDAWMPDYDPYCLGDLIQKSISVDDKVEQLEILDTYGQEEFRTIWEIWIKETHGFVLMYSIISDNSFHHLQTIYKDIV